MFEIGRLCVKLTGRDAGKKCVIIDVIDSHFVLIDGQTRRRKCNIKHLEPLSQTVEVTKEAPGPEVVRVLKELGIEVEEKKPKAKAAKAAKAKTERPRRMRRKKEKQANSKFADSEKIFFQKPVKEVKPAKGAKKQKEKVAEKKAEDAEK